MRDRPAQHAALGRREALTALLGGGLVGSSAFGRKIGAQGDGRFLRIGTGSVTGTYYPVGSVITGIVSSPPGARPCSESASCGVPGLIAIVQTSKGSVDNVEAIQTGQVESGFAQSDVAHSAYTGTGMFAGRPPFTELRALASLYPESVHLVAASGSRIRSVPELRGRRVSLDAEGSGTLVDARLILEAFDLRETDVLPVYAPPGQAIGMMREGRIDALFLVAGYPASAVSELVSDAGAHLVPISGPEVDRLLATYRFFTPDSIPAGIYPGIVTNTPTVSVAALWLVSSKLDDELVYAITRALWHPASRVALTQGHPKGREIRLANALRGVTVPLHPGAARFYREQGMAP